MKSLTTSMLVVLSRLTGELTAGEDGSMAITLYNSSFVPVYMQSYFGSLFSQNYFILFTNIMAVFQQCIPPWCFHISS